MIDRKTMKQKLLKRTEEQNRTKDQGQWGSIFDRTDLPLFNPENGKYKIDIIPYVAGKHDPQVPKGEPTYLLDIYVHRNIGPNNDHYICLAKNYKTNCPICNYRKEYETELTEDEMEALRPKRRTVYNIINRTTEEERRKGIQIWEVAHFFMEKKILPQAENPDTGGVIAFADPEDGYTIFFKKSGSRESTTYEGHKLLPRDYTISQKILDKAMVLDSLVHIPTEEELEKVANGLQKARFKKGSKREDEEEVDDDEEETTTRRKKMRPDVTEEDDEDVRDDYGDEEEEEKPRKKKRVSSDDDDDEEDEEEEEEKPRKKKKAVDEDEDEDEEEEEERPKKKSAKGKCPEGGEFGVDFDKFEECVNCKSFDECSDKKDELDEETSSKKKAKKKVEEDDDEDEEEETPKKKSKFNRRK